MEIDLNNLIDKDLCNEIHGEFLQADDIININGKFYILEDK